MFCWYCQRAYICFRLNDKQMKRVFKQYRNEMFTTAFIEIDSKSGLPVQATATAHKMNGKMIIGPAWLKVKTKDDQPLVGEYIIISEEATGKYTTITAILK